MSVSQWAKIAKRNNERLRLVVQESYVEACSRVIADRSPVLSGLFRNNWFAGLNQPNTKTTTVTAKKGFGEKGGARFTEFLHLSTQFKIGDTLYLTNSLPYARALEYGHSQKMAPGGMVRLTAAEWPQIVSKVARTIK